MTKFDPTESLANAHREFGEHGGVNMSIENSTTFTVIDPAKMSEMFGGAIGPDHGGCYLYGRHFNPTVYVLGREIAAIEGTEAAYCAASGMGAICATLHQLCDSGDHIVASDTLYGGTYAFMKGFMPQKSNVHTSFVKIDDLESVEAAFTDRTKVLYAESMSNPMLAVADIPKLAEIAHKHNAKLIIDNTFAPLIMSPAKLGADIVIHSLTKFMNGASDYVGGAVCGSTEFIRSMMDALGGALWILGPTMDPQTAAAISLRLPHLALRMKAHSERAQVFAERLKERGLDVTYPGLPDHPHYETLARLGNVEEYGYGGLLGIDCGSAEKANELMENLQNAQDFGYMAVSLGYFDTLMSASASSTSSEMTDEDLRKAGILPGYVRISIGYTGSLEQRWQQFERGLNATGLLSGVTA